MAITQKHRPFAVNTSLGEDVLVFYRMVASEQLGRLFEYELELLSERSDLQAVDLLGTNMTVRMQLPKVRGGGTRYFNGFVTRFSYLGIRGVRYGVYSVTLSPWLWFLTCTADCRIFQNKKVPDIIQELFEEHGIADFKVALSGEYRPWEYCVQYRETDFNFLNRLMEQEGIYYYFEHENGRHILVLADSYSSHKKFPEYAQVPYYPPDLMENRERDHLYKWVIETEVRPGKYAVNDFDFKVPRKNLYAISSMPKSHAQADFEVYDYPGKYFEHGEGQLYSRIRLEELHAQHEIFLGQGIVRGLATGYFFALTNSDHREMNREYLIISANYELQSDAYETTAGSGQDGKPYQIRITAINSQHTYRASRITPKPVVQGPQTAIVVGKEGEEIWTDQWGRVKVKFHWDRYSKGDETSSCWIRVAQVWAGKRWGGINIPRIGEEVIVDFLEGDPDRPIITGRVFNCVTTPPYDLPKHATVSTLKTNSSRGGGGFNELRFEDKKGEEQIFIHAEKNQDVRVKNDCYEWIGQDRHLIVKKDKFEHVENDAHDIVDSNHHEKIGEDHHLKIGGKQAIEIGGSHSFTVSGDVMEVFKGNHSEKTSSSYYLKATDVVIESTSGITIKCGGNHVTIDSSGVTIKGSMITLDGQMVKINSGPGTSALSGSAPSAVSPAAPEKALEADKADPGEVAEVKAEQQKKGSGKYGRVPVAPFKRPSEDSGQGDDGGPGGNQAGSQPNKEEKKKKSWIEIVLVDEEDDPVPGERYEITLPDKTVKKGTLDQNGFARVDGIDPGNCEITFPRLDKGVWERA